jgi:hypothetical protein
MISTFSNNALVKARAKALLTISLTERDDLRIEDVRDDSGCDFLVYQTKNGRTTSRVFGVLLRATIRETTPAGVPVTRQLLEDWEESPFPICLVFFYMTDDRGYFRWLVEPVVSPAGEPDLKITVASESANGPSILLPSSSFVELKQASLNQLVSSVEAWYDARSRVRR